MIRSFPPHPNPLPPGERVGHSSPQQSWEVFWHILINCNANDNHFIIEIIDSGIPFDMSSLSDPDVTADVDHRKIGGLGVFLIKKLKDEVRYRRENNQNILNLIIKKDK